jgi:glycerophosphoryl diester phosphodiesterase
MTGPSLRSNVPVSFRRPFLVAHRGGNRLSDLWAAERLRATLVEADVRLHRRRLEVRHLKSAGPLPLLWDRWEVRARRRAQLELSALLEATADETELVLDLKGPRPRLATDVLRLLEPYLDRRRFTVCARRWALLETFSGTPVRSVHSVGSARQLRQLLRRFAEQRLEGVSIHERLVDSPTMASLRGMADLVMTWPVNRPERARALLGLGVDGLITDDPASLSQARVLEATA